jgi:hypothetical protein
MQLSPDAGCSCTRGGVAPRLHEALGGVAGHVDLAAHLHLTRFLRLALLLLPHVWHTSGMQRFPHLGPRDTPSEASGPLRDWGVEKLWHTSHYEGPALLGLCTSDHDRLYHLQLNHSLNRSVKAARTTRTVAKPHGTRCVADVGLPAGASLDLVACVMTMMMTETRATQWSGVGPGAHLGRHGGGGGVLALRHAFVQLTRAEAGLGERLHIPKARSE